MASNMDWSPDFCIICDTQMSEGGQGVYCSQACRLAELEKSGSLGSPTSSARLSSSASSTGSTGGFYLPPAVNFSAFRTPTSSRGFDMGPYQQQYHPANYAYHQASTSSKSPSLTRQLSPSSSRSSLSSSTASQSQASSTQTASQLDSYVRSFDQVRQMKRRYH